MQGSSVIRNQKTSIDDVDRQPGAISTSTVRLVKDPVEAGSLSDAWDQICTNSCVTPMQEHIWCITCTEILEDQARLAVMAVEAGDRLLALAPLVRCTGIFRGYEQLNPRALGEPGDLIYTDKSALNTLLEGITGLKQPVKLGRIRADTPTATAITHAFRGKGIVLTSERGGYPYIPLNSLTADPETSLQGRLRSDLRRARRKADATGLVSFEIIRPASSQEFLSLYDSVLKVESAGWKGRSGSALATDTMPQQFYRRYGIRAAEKGILRLAFMRIDSAIVAMQFAVQTCGRFWLLKIGYDEEYAMCSPGHLLLLETLRYAWAQRLVSYEFLGRSETWTQRWTTLERPTVRVDACPYNIKGMLALACKLARLAWLKAYGRPAARQ
jgi:CelD/BcsL family acetyltransferase involved in cellulose biosynthesis